MTTQTNPYIDEWDRHLGWCNSCGEEAVMNEECQNELCDGDGEIVPYDDDPNPEE